MSRVYDSVLLWCVVPRHQGGALAGYYNILKKYYLQVERPGGFMKLRDASLVVHK